MKVGVLLAVVVSLSAGTKAATISGERSVNTVTSIDELETLFHEQQLQYLPIAPPDVSRRYIHSSQMVYPVDFLSGQWPRALTGQMVAELRALKHSKGIFPVYSLTVLTDFLTGDMVCFDGQGRELYREPTRRAFRPYAWAITRFGVENVAGLSEFQRSLYHIGRIGLTLELTPEPFMEAYEQDVAMTALASFLASPMALMSAPAGVTDLTLAIGTTESNEVEVGIYFPAGYTNPVDVFACTSLAGRDWSLFTNLSSVGLSEFTWIDEAADNLPVHFWVAAQADANSDADALSDSHEIYLYGTNPLNPDTDNDGIDDGVEVANGTDPLFADGDGDEIGDAAEVALAASIQGNGNGGVLVVIPQTGWYHAIDPDLNLVFLGGR